MFRFAIIENNEVSNVAVADQALANNWIRIDNMTPEPGKGWTTADNGQTFIPPVLQTLQTIADPTEWLVDIGPFFDRFGALKIPILSDTDVVVRAIVTDCTSRHWIDLKRPDVALAIDTLINKGFAVDKAAILGSPATPAENLALRKLYFS